jgi:hypothetical protein
MGERYLVTIPRIEGERGYVFTYSGKHGMTCFNPMKQKLDTVIGFKDWTLHKRPAPHYTGLLPSARGGGHPRASAFGRRGGGL